MDISQVIIKLQVRNSTAETDAKVEHEAEFFDGSEPAKDNQSHKRPAADPVEGEEDAKKSKN